MDQAAVGTAAGGRAACGALLWSVQTVASTGQPVILDTGPVALVLTPPAMLTTHGTGSVTFYNVVMPRGSGTRMRRLIGQKRPDAQLGLGTAELSLWVAR